MASFSNAESVFRQPGFDAVNTAKLPFNIPRAAPPPSSYALASVFSQLAPRSSAPWIPICSPVIDSAGTAYWAIINSDVGIKLVSVPISNPPNISASVDISSLKAIDLDSSRARTAYLALGAADTVLVMFQAEGKIQGWRSQKAEKILSTFTSPTLSASKFDPLISDSGSQAYALSATGFGNPCVLHVDMETGKTECKEIGYGGSSPLAVTLSLDDNSNLLIVVDGNGAQTPFANLPIDSSKTTVVSDKTPGIARLRTVPGQPDHLLSIGFDSGTVSLLDTTQFPWRAVWWSNFPGFSNFAVAIDAERHWLYLCLGAPSEDQAAEGRLTAIRISDGYLGWNGGSSVVTCSKDAVLLSADGAILTVTQSGLISLINVSPLSSDINYLWTVGVPAQDPLSSVPFLPPVVWSKGGSQVYIFSGATAVGFADFPPKPTTSTSLTTSTGSATNSATSSGSVTLPPIEPTGGGIEGNGSNGLTGTNLILAIAIPLLVLAIAAILLAVCLRRRRKQYEGEKPPAEPPSRDGYPANVSGLQAIGSGIGIAGISSSNGPKTDVVSGSVKARDVILESSAVAAGSNSNRWIPHKDEDEDSSSFKSAVTGEWNNNLAARRESAISMAPSEATIKSPIPPVTPDSQLVSGESRGSSLAAQYPVPTRLGRKEEVSFIPSPPADSIRLASMGSQSEMPDQHYPPSPVSTPSLPRPNVGIARATPASSRATSPSAASSGYAASVSSGATQRPRNSGRISPRSSMSSLDRSSRRSTADSEFWEAPANVMPVVPMPNWQSDEDEEERWRNMVFGDRRAPVANTRSQPGSIHPSTHTDAETFVTVPDGSRSDGSRSVQSRANRWARGGSASAGGESRSRTAGTSETDNEGYVTAASSRHQRESPRNVTSPSDGFETAQSEMDSGTEGYQTGREY
ncbi:hypothetical protein HDU97_000793 [Phlyctochytrium planicorne]|nr:hypothetical protein HDU97_000793 [Phlyctochytrium planicorne]